MVAAIEVASVLWLDRLLLVVANEPWQKVATQTVSPAAIRYAMVAAAVGDHPPLEASDLEMRRGGQTLTADTLEDLRATDPDADLFLIVGSDVASQLLTWKRPEIVRELATLVVLDRPGHEGGRPPVGWSHEIVEIADLEVASSELRERVRTGRPIDFLVPDPVIEIIRQHRLYRDPESP